MSKRKEDAKRTAAESRASIAQLKEQLQSADQKLDRVIENIKRKVENRAPFIRLVKVTR